MKVNPNEKKSVEHINTHHRRKSKKEQVNQENSHVRGSQVEQVGHLAF